MLLWSDIIIIIVVVMLVISSRISLFCFVIFHFLPRRLKGKVCSLRIGTLSHLVCMVLTRNIKGLYCFNIAHVLLLCCLRCGGLVSVTFNCLRTTEKCYMGTGHNLLSYKSLCSVHLICRIKWNSNKRYNIGVFVFYNIQWKYSTSAHVLSFFNSLTLNLQFLL